MKNNRLRVLVIAHELSPRNGSECAEGWNIVTRLARFHDVTVFYASGSHGNFTSYFNDVKNYINANGPIEGLEFINIDQPGMTRFLVSLNKPFRKFNPATGLPVLYFLGYKYWQRSAFAKAMEFHKKEKFDVVHQLTQITFREPGYWWKMNIPFFWGPTGGTRSFPKAFHDLLSSKSRLLERVRMFSNYLQYNFSRRVVKANKTASVIYTYSNADAVELGKRATGKIKLMLDAGTTDQPQVIDQARPAASIIKGIWCGQLIERKAAGLLLKAIALSKLTKEAIKFQVIGSGPLETALIEESKALGLTNIEWIRNVDRAGVFKMMKEADFFVHTSLREGTPHVIMEALSSGLPVICHDEFGMGIAINDSCGIKVPLISPGHSVKGFHEAMERLVSDKKLLEKLKTGALKRTPELSWDKMAGTMAKDYLSVINNKYEEL
ncbi:MAG: glycosyltransferase [Ferruginibacter sp.]